MFIPIERKIDGQLDRWSEREQKAPEKESQNRDSTKEEVLADVEDLLNCACVWLCLG